MPKEFIDETGKRTSEAAALMRYFRKADETLQDFMTQVKALTPDAKTELAVGAAKELCWAEAP